MTEINKQSFQQQLEHSQLKYTGTGHPDITKYEWITNQQRDSYSSYIGHQSLLSYISVAENQSIGRTKYVLLERMCDPCGKPPPVNNAFQLTEQDISNK